MATAAATPAAMRKKLAAAWGKIPGKKMSRNLAATEKGEGITGIASKNESVNHTKKIAAAPNTTVLNPCSAERAAKFFMVNLQIMGSY